MIPIVNIIEEIVLKTEAIVLPGLVELDSKITGVHYDHGHPLEIMETLKQKDKTKSYKFQLYPIIALFQDFPESVGGNLIEREATLHLIIGKGTKNTYKASERYEKNIIPYLYPIYEEFINQISLDSRVIAYGPQSIEHQKTDRLYWGVNGLFGNSSNIFDSYLDVIEIKNLKLKLNIDLC